MMKRILALLSSALLAVSLAACATGTIPSQTAGPTATPVPTAKLDNTIDIKSVAFQPADKIKQPVGDALGAFSIDLFQRLAARDAGKNVFLSPLSVWLALSMTYNGASGPTAEGMAAALHAAGIPIGDINADNKGLIGILAAADPDVNTAIANSIWLGKAYEKDVDPGFLDANRNFYDAKVETVDFLDSGAVPAINGWVEGKTNGKIKDLVQPPLSPQTVMILINAVYFNAPWKQAFDPKLTGEGDFTMSDGKTVTARYMYRREGNIGYADDDIRVVSLPYSTGRLELVALMPDRQPLKEFVKALTPEKMQEYIGKCSRTNMTLTFPKFKIEYSASLKDTLIAMGMQEAFDQEAAEFKKMSASIGDQLFITKVEHKSFINVDEAGTEAAAATSVVMEAMAMRLELDFKKPFVYLIHDTVTGAILFIGTMENPA